MIFGWNENRRKSKRVLKNLLLIRILEILQEPKSHEKLNSNEQLASRSTFAHQKSTEIENAKNRARTILFREHVAEARKLKRISKHHKSSKLEIFIVPRSPM